MMPKDKLNILQEIYRVYDAYVQKFTFVCQPGCYTCCTQNVLVTTLETLYFLLPLKEKNEEILNYISTAPQVLKPTYTTNEFAYYCLHKKNVPEEQQTYVQTNCVFLKEKKCLIYPWRPFSCRSFFSQARCDLVGEALIPPELLTINLIIMQIIEHLDTNGCYGNMNDIILFLQDKNNLDAYLKGKKLSLPEGLRPNWNIPGFLYPPEHRQEVTDILKQLKEIRAFDPTSLPALEL